MASQTLASTLGAPGGDSQPQSLLQIVNNLLLFGMTPQEAADALQEGLERSVTERLASVDVHARVVHFVQSPKWRLIWPLPCDQ